MIKVVINKDFGGFGLSDEAEALYKERKGITDPDWWYGEMPRDCPVLVQIVEVPDDADWYVEEYDGSEWVAERHRTWS